MAAQSVSDETQRYFDKHQVPRLMEFLYHELALARPDKPLEYLHGLLQNPPRPRLILTGPPASGKGTQCALIVERYGVVHVSTGQLLRAEVRTGTELGRQAEEYMGRGELVPDALITSLVHARLQQDDVKRQGWLLDGFPRTRAQALSLQLAGILPDALVVLAVPDDTVTTRLAGRRVDPATEAVYHVEHNPPPPGVHAVARPEDSPEALAPRLKLYRQHLAQLRHVYESVAVAVDGDRPKEEVFADIVEQIDARALA